MLEFMRVEGAPKLFPYNCRFCQSGKDLLDTHAEDHVGRLYVCRMCISRGARVFGMIEGNRYQELTQADTLLVAANKALEQTQARVAQLTGELEGLDQAYVEALQELATARQRIQQLEDATRARAQEELALVGVGVTRDWEPDPVGPVGSMRPREEHDDAKDEDEIYPSLDQHQQEAREEDAQADREGDPEN